MIHDGNGFTSDELPQCDVSFEKGKGSGLGVNRHGVQARDFKSPLFNITTIRLQAEDLFGWSMAIRDLVILTRAMPKKEGASRIGSE
jgi:hypothetical protein